MSRERLEALDGLRGVAACGVAFAYHPLLELDPALMARASAPIIWMRDWGWSFVDLFFLISGYIFAHVYLRQRPLKSSDLGDFAVARIARLYPLHIVTFAICALLFLSEHKNTWYALIAHLLMLQAFISPLGQTFNGPSWSISVELVCYVLFALAATRGGRTLRWVTAVAIAVPLVYLLVFARPGGPWIADCIPRGPLGFFMGQTLWRWRAPMARVPAWVLATAIGIGLTVDVGRMSPLLPLCLLAWPATLALAMRSPLLTTHAMRWLGDRSYTIYLAHFPLLLVCVPSLERATNGWAATALMLGFAGLSLTISDLAYRYLEVPSRRALRAVWQRHSGHTAAPAVAA